MPPFVGVAVNVTLVPEQIVLPGLAAMLTDGVTVDPTLIVMVGELTVTGVAQPIDEVIATVIVSPLANALFEYVLLFVPTLTPFNRHWYNGDVPPFVGKAVNVTLVPAQMVLPGFAETLTEGVTDEVRLIVMPFDVAGLVQANDEVITTVTTSPLVSVLFE